MKTIYLYRHYMTTVTHLCRAPAEAVGERFVRRPVILDDARLGFQRPYEDRVALRDLTAGGGGVGPQLGEWGQGRQLAHQPLLAAELDGKLLDSLHEHWYRKCYYYRSTDSKLQT